MNLEDLAELEAKATPGPWSTRTTVCGCADGMCAHPDFSYAFKHCNIDEIPSEDLDFLVALRNIAPELIQFAIVCKEVADTCLGRDLKPIDRALEVLSEKLEAMEPFF